MKQYKVIIGAVRFEADQNAPVYEQGTIAGADETNEIVQQLVAAGAIEEVVEETDEEKAAKLAAAEAAQKEADDAAAAEIKAAEEAAAAAAEKVPGGAPEEPRVRFHGQVVIADGERTVENQTFHHIKIEDGSEYDLTDAEYATEVKVAYPPVK